MDLVEWLKERELNARRLAQTKTGDDREGWLEDARNFQAAADAAKKCARLDTMLCAAFKRRATVEQSLYDMASGKAPMPDAAKLRELALHLGVPDSEAPA